jgi:flagellar biosynthetic protein FliO
MENISYIGSLLKMLFALAVVLGLMIGTVYMLKKIMGRARPGADNGELIKILAVKSLGPRSSIMMIETLGKVIVVGVAGGQMNALADIDDPEALAQVYAMRRNACASRPPLPMALPLDALRDKIMKTLKRK